ncbi:acetylglutamate kinase [Gracilibacillus halophilus YIM-C55.5]|uniref:Acetylglutamate kinase n=1 Tax=Gracilibacillus halophilus YIM-C55.5 TaxID=1308866 RepID=N4WAQ7_9BACI|nr:acetylglutamate kinase [Gracilibacillus halophilus]ENH96349.1 acetylglutamate kinase [Gracilibacillus halophilus YIM-C55.5]
MNYVVIKCGGSVFEQLSPSFYQDIITLSQQGEWQPIIVHGGGPYISELLEQTGVTTQFVDGLRVTTNDVLDVVEMALSGSINKQIVRQLHQSGGTAIGLSGVDGNLLGAKPVAGSEQLGFVGEVTAVNTAFIQSLSESQMIPVIAPIGLDQNSQRYNINADMAASAIAQALEAKLCFISDIPGIYQEVNGEKQVFHQLDQEQIQALIEKEVIFGGMIPKVHSALAALEENVPEVSIVNGTRENGLLDFMQGEAVGTRIIRKEEVPYG